MDGVQPCEALIEVDIGLYSGLTWQQAAERFPDYHRRFLLESWDGVPGAEHADVLYVRGEDVWRRLRERFNNGDHHILAVTHSGMMQWIIKVTLGHRRWLPLFPMRNCSISQFTINNRMLPPDESHGQESPAFYYAWKRVVPSRCSGYDHLNICCAVRMGQVSWRAAGRRWTDLLRAPDNGLEFRPPYVRLGESTPVRCYVFRGTALAVPPRPARHASEPAAPAPPA